MHALWYVGQVEIHRLDRRDMGEFIGGGDWVIGVSIRVFHLFVCNDQ